MPARITIRDNGSIRIEGDFELFDGQGRKFELPGRTRISLCRCGKTKDTPFCDHSHRETCFQSVVVARVVPPPEPSS